MIKRRLSRSTLQVLVFLIFAALALAWCTGDSNLLRPPIVTSIKLDQPGVIANLRFKVDEHRFYYFILTYKFPKDDKIERERVRKIVGGNEVDYFGKAKEPGIPTPIRLLITKFDRDFEIEIHQKEIDPVLTSWGADTFSRHIASCYLQPGIYRVQIEALKPAPEVASIPTEFAIASPPNIRKVDPTKIDRSKLCPQ